MDQMPYFLFITMLLQQRYSNNWESINSIQIVCKKKKKKCGQNRILWRFFKIIKFVKYKFFANLPVLFQTINLICMLSCSSLSTAKTSTTEIKYKKKNEFSFSCI